MVRFFICISFIWFAISCGKQKFPDYSNDAESDREEHKAGLYGAKFLSINPQIVHSFKAHSVLWIRGHQFYVRVIITSHQPRVRHIQAIHVGPRCPKFSDDINKDRVLDYEEVMKVTGPMLIPLDRSLKSQTHGSEWFPSTDREGTMNYSRSVAIYHLMNDLRLNDPTPQDFVSKLAPSENLDLHLRTIVIYGTSRDHMLPIACAEINKEEFK